MRLRAGPPEIRRWLTQAHCAGPAHALAQFAMGMEGPLDVSRLELAARVVRSTTVVAFNPYLPNQLLQGSVPPEGPCTAGWPTIAHRAAAATGALPLQQAGGQGAARRSQPVPVGLERPVHVQGARNIMRRRAPRTPRTLIAPHGGQSCTLIPTGAVSGLPVVRCGRHRGGGAGGARLL